MINVALGLVVNPQKQILVARRPQHLTFGDLWEFPGGKVKLGETSYLALYREFIEEINIHIKSAQFFCRVEHEYPQCSVGLDVWEILEYEGIPCGAENQIVDWVPIKSLSALSFPEGNQKIIARIQQIVFSE